MKNKLTINTDERIFLIHYYFDGGKKDMCNLSQIEKLVKSANQIEKIDHFWNGKFTKISKKDLKAMLEAHRMDTKFIDSI